MILLFSIFSCPLSLGITVFHVQDRQEASRGALLKEIHRFFTRSRKRKEEDDFFMEHFFRCLQAEGGESKKRNTCQRPGGSNLKGRVDYGNTPWARMLRENADELEQPDSMAGKLFRLRFRIPYPVFLRLLAWTKAWHEKNSTDASGRQRIPTELKLLGVLRILGRGTCFDGIEELSGISVPTMHSFFHSFTAWFVESVSIFMCFWFASENSLQIWILAGVSSVCVNTQKSR